MKSARANESAPLVPAPRKVVARYPIATIGSRTRRGGEVVLAQGEPADDFRIACVGDRVRYPDGSESVIVSGAGHASTYAKTKQSTHLSHHYTDTKIANRFRRRQTGHRNTRT